MARDPNPVVNVPHTLTVQYLATSLDGATPSIPFSTDSGNPDFIPPNPSGIYVVPRAGVEVPALGLIDPDQGVGGSMGDRFIPWMSVFVDVATTVTISIVDAEDPGADLLVLEADVVVTPELPLYRNSCFRVPQGGQIRIVTADPTPARVRLRIIVSIEETCDDSSGGANGATGDAPMQELILDAYSVAFNAMTPVEGGVNLNVPTGFTPVVWTRVLTTEHVVLIYNNSTEEEIAAVFQTVLPLVYHGGDLQIELELGGDAVTPVAGDAEMYALIEAMPPGTDYTVLAFGAEIDLTTEIPTDTSIVRASSLVSGAQLDGLVAGDAFRVLIGRHPNDEYNGSVLFFRGRIREILP